MAIKFTKDQQRAIALRGCNILVSAAAGSGKTAVLTERVAQLIHEGVALDRLVVLTFTDAAAMEMRLRIRKRLIEQDDQPRVKEALEHLSRANIRTFDSYALSILRRYGYRINISPHVKIGDTVQLKLKHKQLLDTLFEQQYEAENSDFLEYVRTYENKHDRALREQINLFYEQLAIHPDFYGLLERFGPEFYHADHFETVFANYHQEARQVLSVFKTTLASRIQRWEAHEAVANFFCEVSKMCAPWFSDLSYDSHVEHIRTAGWPRSNQATSSLKETPEDLAQFKADKDYLQALFKEITTQWFVQKEADHRSDFTAAGKHVGVIVELLKAYHQAILTWQLEAETLSFSSVARLAYQILQDDPHVRQELRASIAEVMVDEYQDTNHMQEAFIDMITDQNVFRVGDVKQSIYRFRHAEPRLFMDTYKRFNHQGTGTVIDLQENFRSRSEIINDVNRVFALVMDSAIGGVDYRGSQRLSYGNQTYTNNVDPSAEIGLQLPIIEPDTMQEAMTDYRLNEQELTLFAIAQDIRKKVGVMKIYDDAQKTLRPATYTDFAILSAVSAPFDTLSKIFNHFGIPVEIYKGDPFTHYHDMHVYRHLLNLVYSFTASAPPQTSFRHSVLSLLRSYLCEASDDAIFKQMMDVPQKPTLQNTAWIHPPFEPFFTQVIKLVEIAYQQPLYRFWQTLVDRFDLHRQLIQLPQTKQAIDRLDYLTQMIASLSEQGFVLADLIDHFDRLLAEKIDIEFESVPSGEHGVKVMTIHKSKGLQFPIVYIPQVSRRFKQNRAQSHFSTRYGFILQHVHKTGGLAKSFLFDLYQADEQCADLSERLRVLYVAMTRAQEACIIPLMAKSPSLQVVSENDLPSALQRVRAFKAYQDILISVRDQLSVPTVLLDASELGLTDNFRFNLTPKAYQGDAAITRDYKPVKTPDYAMVSTAFSAGVTGLLNREQWASIERGTVIHDLFERIDFQGDIEAQIAGFADIDGQAKSWLRQFFDHPLIRSLDIQCVYKEFPFAFSEAATTTTGYMDLLIETAESFVIIDYKLKETDKLVYRKQLEGYHQVLQKMTEKPVEAYLYSIIDGTFECVIKKG